MISKEWAREHGRAVRAKLTEAEREEDSRRIVASCQEVLDWAKYRRVHVFVPIGRQHEVDTWPLLAWIWEVRPAISVYVPRMKGEAMEHVLVTRETRFEAGAFGVPEPVGGEVAVAGEQMDLILVPLLAFDKAGRRAGYGGGHYDRFLASQRDALRVGLAYEAARLDEPLEVRPHDVALQMVITERAVHRF